MHCPSCGAEIEADTRFAHLVVCSYCDSAIIVDEEAARVAGKMAVLSPTSSPFYVGGSGTLEGRRFTVLGRVRYGYEKGFWDEWYLTFDDDTTAWVSEDENTFTLETLAEAQDMPGEYATITPGDQIEIGDTRYAVNEKDVAECEGGEGQLPFSVLTGEKTPFLDLSAGDNVATVECDLDDQTSRVFQGRRLDINNVSMDMSAEEAGVAGSTVLRTERAAGKGKRERVTRQTSRAQELKCYYCGAPLEIPDAAAESMECQYCGSELDLTLRRVSCENCGATVPMHGGDAARSVVCSFCNSQLDVSRGEPSVLANILDENRPDLPFKLGQTCTLRGETYLLVGHLRYKQSFYVWDEFLLYSKERGYTWLTMDDGHFSFGREITQTPPDIGLGSGFYPDTFAFNGHTWEFYEDGRAEITFVDGELPWVAKVGDTANYLDAVDPPYKLSAEWTHTEAEWFELEYVPRKEIAEAFNIDRNDLPVERGIAPHQPYPAGPFRRQYPFVTGVFAVVFLLLALYAWVGTGKGCGTLQITPQQYAQEYITEPFTVHKSNAVCKAKFRAPVDNTWVYLDVAVLDEQDRVVNEFSTQMSYYHGRSGGENWSEGSRGDAVVFKVKDPGEYRLLVLGQAGAGSSSGSGNVLRDGKTVKATVYEGVAIGRYFIVAAVVCIAATVLEIVRRKQWYTQRMGEDED